MYTIKHIIHIKHNSYGQLLIDFLVDCNLCMINGRSGENDFTNINTNGSSVVDYIIVPHEQLHKYYDLKVHTMTSVINSLNLHGHNKTSEHSILQVVLRDKTVKNRPDSKQVKTTKPLYNVNDISASFLNCETSFRRLSECIGRIEKALQDKNDVQSAYAEFIELLKVEMESKLKPKKCFTSNMPANKSHKSKVKSYWNSELQFLWDQTCKCEKLWLANKRGVNKNKLKQEYCLIRKQFDKLNSKCKRRFQLEQQQLLQDRLENRDNPRDFWAKIGKLGLANDRRTVIPWEVKDENGCITTDKDYVLSKWKSDYEKLFNDNLDNRDFDDGHLNKVRECIQDPDNPAFPELDCSTLNVPVSREEVRTAIYNAKLRKAPGNDYIPLEVLRNDNCVDILFRIIHYCFEAGVVPNE